MLKWMFFFLIPLAFLNANAKESCIFITKDYQKGKELAYAYHMPMALIFTGSDWSKASLSLLKEWLFNEEAFKDLSKKVLCVWIDIPELNLKPSDLLEQDYQLHKKYGVNGYPLIILLDQMRKEICRIGYPIGEKENLSDLILKKMMLYEKVLKKWEKAKRLKESSLISYCYQKGLELKCRYLVEEIFNFALSHQICLPLLLEHYAYLALKEEEKEHTAKELKEYLLTQNSDHAFEIKKRIALIEFQKKEDPTLLIKLLKQFSNQKQENFWKIHLLLSYYFFDHKNMPLAMQHAQITYRDAPFEKKEVIWKFIEKIFKKLS